MTHSYLDNVIFSTIYNKTGPSEKKMVGKWILEDFDTNDYQAVQNWDAKFQEFPILTDFKEIRWGSIFTSIEKFLKDCL